MNETFYRCDCTSGYKGFNCEITDFEHSTILTTSEMKDNLINLIQLDHSNKWIMIYPATRDGFEASTFHSKCDNKPNTLVIIRSTSGNVFGGYTEQSWSSSSGYKTDPNAFIFSLINKQNKPLKMKCSKCESAIYCHNYYGHGPTFGGDLHDLHISDVSNTNKDSYSNLGASYSHPDYAYGSNEAKSFLAGSNKFQISDLEVFSKQ
jgi:hypothetical protein